MERVTIPEIDLSQKKRNISVYSDEQIKNVFIDYLFEGKSHRKLDEEVLKLDSQKTKGFQSMAILHNYGVTAPFKGVFRGLQINQGVELLREDPVYESIVNIITYNDPVEIPPLVKQNRKSEFNKYTQYQISEVVYQYLFLSKTHRQLDKEVLSLDYKKTKGFQSFAILNYLGLNGSFKGLFYGKSIDEGLDILKRSKGDCSKIIDILLTYKDHVNNGDFKNTVTKSNEIKQLIGKQEKAEEVIELVLLDYSMHGSQRRK